MIPWIIASSCGFSYAVAAYHFKKILFRERYRIVFERKQHEDSLRYGRIDFTPTNKRYAATDASMDASIMAVLWPVLVPIYYVARVFNLTTEQEPEE